ncbi:MAG TPA: serine/threonine-protein kinase [Polyangiaceae bacterium]|jgi:serine/threonine-protein kinase
MAEAASWIIAGRYEVGDIVGRGGYGMVRRAIDRKTGKVVALKVLSADAGRDPNLVERMLREQQAMVALEGTCAVSAIDLCQLPSGAPCLVMEWLEGRDLEHQLNEWEAAGVHPSISELLVIVRPIAETLGRAHELGIVHRDIKPANVFLTRAGDGHDATLRGGVRLLDFGLSRMRTAAPLTAMGMVMGSPSYIPPETWRGNSALIDQRADLYSLAVIVFRALTGKLPFDTPSLLKKLELVTTAERPSVRALRPDLSPAIDGWMKRALAVDPAARFQSAREFYDSLTHALNPNTNGDDEVSGVRAKASASPRGENKKLLTLAWQRATSLLQRFIGQKATQGEREESDAASASVEVKAQPIRPVVPVVLEDESAGRVAAAELELENVLAAEDRPSVAWLDDSEVEDAPESTRAAGLGLTEAKARSDVLPKSKRAKKGKTKAEKKSGQATPTKNKAKTPKRAKAKQTPANNKSQKKPKKKPAAKKKR